MSEYRVAHGAHRTREAGMCAMEWTAYLAGEDHTDKPKCVCRVLQRFCIWLNDRMHDDERQQLRPYLARTIGTAGDGQHREREDLLREWEAAQGLDDNIAGKTIVCLSTDAGWKPKKISTLPESTIASALSLLDRMLPTEIIQLPVVEEWREVCQVA